MIRAHNLTKRFGSFTAIEDVSFEVKRGEVVGFLGPNGAGKSTTMRILAGVFPPSRGQATIAGYDVVREPLRARSVVGYFPERISLYVDMVVERYLRYVGEMKGLDRSNARREAAQAMKSCGLDAVASRLIGSLSKGFRQRIGIAQALVGTPRVLILDEPTSGLDPEQVAEVRDLIRSLRGERTVILSTHILSEVEATCDRVIIIHRGRVLAVDTPANLNQHLRVTSQIYIEAVGPEPEILATLENVPGVLQVARSGDGAGSILPLTITTRKDQDLRQILADEIIRHGWGLRELRPVSLSLEEIFLSLVGVPERHNPTEAEDEGSSRLPA
jgi:gliding motility-associated transport system ATP-binding protein